MSSKTKTELQVEAVAKAPGDRLFVYGIFLGERTRHSYGMTNPQYTTVAGYVTVGRGIVQAVAVKDQEIALTGLVVDVDPEWWGSIDYLEGGYDRIIVKTDWGEDVWMYARPTK